MHKYLIFLLTAALSLTFACPSLASARGGDRNFERAWRVFTSRQTDKAVEYFKAAAQEYGQALEEDPPSRTLRFSSTLIKAGISFFYAGDYDQCLDVMKLSTRKNERIWEADIYTALAYARKGEQEEALNSLDLFLEALSSQRILSAEVLAQLPGMRDGSISLADGMERIEQSLQNQFVENIVKNQNWNSNKLPNEQCNGKYWWRMNAAPCSAPQYDYH